MLTYKQLKPILYRAAWIFANYKYEVDELINAVWLMGDVQKLPDIRLAYHRIRYDMINYIRTQEGRKKRSHSLKPSHKYRTNFVSYNAETDFDDNDEHTTYEMYLSTEDDGFAKVDFEDELESLMKSACNNCLDRLIVKMRLDGFTHKEIGKVFGLSESRISQIMTGIGKRLLVKIKDNSIGYNKENIKELINERIKNGRIKKEHNINKQTVCEITSTHAVSINTE